MKTLHGFGVELRPLEAKDLEMVRQWRNAAHVRANFEYQGHIGSEDQEKWFREMDLSSNFYWVIVQGNEAVGVVHAKEIDWEGKVAEAGIFVGEKAYLGTPVAAAAILCMMDFMFGEMKMEALRAKVKADSSANVKLNLQLGYELLPGQEGKPFQVYRCTPDRYFSAFRARFPFP